MTLLGRLQPERAYLRLFNEIVLDVWNARLGEAKMLRSRPEAVVRQKQQRLEMPTARKQTPGKPHTSRGSCSDR